jgi:hypothetical protein
VSGKEEVASEGDACGGDAEELVERAKEEL